MARPLTIGAFARLTHLTPKALRVYEAAGVLLPDHVDPANGYRWYLPEQAHRARLIGLLRGAEMGLAEIRDLMGDLERDIVGDHPAGRHAAAVRLDRHLQRLEAEHAGRRLLVRHIDALVRGKEPPMFTIRTRHVPAQRVMSIQRRLHADQTDTFVAEARTAFATHLGDRAATGPFTLIFHGVVDHESDGPIEAVLRVPTTCRPPI